MTELEVKAVFLSELSALFVKWGADLSAEDHWLGYPECGEDIRVTISIPGVLGTFTIFYKN